LAFAWAIPFHAPVPYAAGARLQEILAAARAVDRIPDTVLLLEHPPVVTLGARGRRQHLKLTPDELERRGIALAHASRGGDVTYHGPGQLIIYPILRLGGAEADAHGYLHNLEEIAIRTAADFGVTAWRRAGKNGAWTAAGKIAAIGFRLKRWITLHGMSFNVDVDLAGFDTIVPCGLAGEPVASLKTILGPAGPTVAQVRAAMQRHFAVVCGRKLQVFEPPAAYPPPIAEAIRSADIPGIV